ncbi:hypothetical protein AX27061_3083 [Achromobacter xylosoxidans NBRC 15126 = ATCC 27061]|nr:hypothetical protein AX27061_3083 [Achromobacter xylosoxidans NBRC 15126 = ATCC 27061]CCH08871.1 hypothetical protein NH44784_049281 [Achromobacter xylosoxidans NH44784-1996]
MTHCVSPRAPARPARTAICAVKITLVVARPADHSPVAQGGRGRVTSHPGQPCRQQGTGALRRA